uniref:Uncharacterized protein n=1 Tax=Sinocyclocheilus anshuiensis TaxID=1608454 RepID=A0A671QIE8_9TELE
CLLVGRYVGLSVSLSVCHSICLLISRCVGLSVALCLLSVGQSMGDSVCLSFCWMCLGWVCLSVMLAVCWSVIGWVCLSVGLFICRSVCLSTSDLILKCLYSSIIHPCLSICFGLVVYIKSCKFVQI